MPKAKATAKRSNKDKGKGKKIIFDDEDFDECNKNEKTSDVEVDKTIKMPKGKAKAKAKSKRASIDKGSIEKPILAEEDVADSTSNVEVEDSVKTPKGKAKAKAKSKRKSIDEGDSKEAILDSETLEDSSAGKTIKGKAKAKAKGKAKAIAKAKAKPKAIATSTKRKASMEIDNDVDCDDKEIIEECILTQNSNRDNAVEKVTATQDNEVEKATPTQHSNQDNVVENAIQEGEMEENTEVVHLVEKTEEKNQDILCNNDSKASENEGQLHSKDENHRQEEQSSLDVEMIDRKKLEAPRDSEEVKDAETMEQQEKIKATEAHRPWVAIDAASSCPAQTTDKNNEMQSSLKRKDHDDGDSSRKVQKLNLVGGVYEDDACMSESCDSNAPLSTCEQSVTPHIPPPPPGPPPQVQLPPMYSMGAVCPMYNESQRMYNQYLQWFYSGGNTQQSPMYAASTSSPKETTSSIEQRLQALSKLRLLADAIISVRGMFAEYTASLRGVTGALRIIASLDRSFGRDTREDQSVQKLMTLGVNAIKKEPKKFTHGELVDLVWSFAKIGIDEGPVICRYCSEELLSRVRSLTVNQVTNVIWAMPRLLGLIGNVTGGPSMVAVDKTLFEEMAKALKIGNLKHLTPDTLTSIVKSYQIMGVKDLDMLSVVGKLILEKQGYFNDRDWATCVTTYTQLGIPLKADVVPQKRPKVERDWSRPPPPIKPTPLINYLR